MTDGHLFNNISLGGRAGNNPGQFKLYSGGLAWKKQGGGKIIEVDKADITSMTWMRIPRSYQLGIGTKEGLFYRFFGFREQDVSNLTNFIQKSTGISPEEKQLSVSGHNWGGIEISGNMLSFNVDTKEAFEVPLADVSQTQMQRKTDVVLEFHVDDTNGANEKDSLMDLSFHVQTSNTQFVGDEHRPPAQILWQMILSKADVGSSEEAVVTFDGIAILTPRGSILRLFVLPKFETEAVIERDLTLSQQVLAEKYKDRLEGSYKGLIHEVFSKILRGLSSAKVTRPSTFHSSLDGYAVKSSLKAEDGLLYPLEKGFFFLPKPPTLILHVEIEYVDFERHGAGGAGMSSQYFDLLVKLKNDQEHLFRNIQRNEYHNLFNFISGKHLKILNLGDGQGRSGVTAVLQSTDHDSVDPHLERIKNQAGDEESDEENLKDSNPELATTEIAKKLGERWQKMTAEEKQPYIEQSQVDKKRYAEETAASRGAAPVDVDSSDGSD